MQWVPPPQADHIEQNYFLYRHGLGGPWENHGPRRRYPSEVPFREYRPDLRGWYQGSRRLTHFRPNHYWTRPHDGKRPGALGRLKDALTGEGADVFVTSSGDKRTLMRDRPQKHEWSGWEMDAQRRQDFWYDQDTRLQDAMLPREATWTNSSSRQGAKYNFWTRKYEAPRQWWQGGKVWRDAQWRPGAKRNDASPYNYQSPNEQWWSRVPWTAGEWPGGRPNV